MEQRSNERKTEELEPIRTTSARAIQRKERRDCLIIEEGFQGLELLMEVDEASKDRLKGARLHVSGDIAIVLLVFAMVALVVWVSVDREYIVTSAMLMVFGLAALVLRRLRRCTHGKNPKKREAGSTERRTKF